MDNKTVIERLRDIQKESWIMSKESLSPEEWEKDVDALELAIERLQGNQEPIKWKELKELQDDCPVWDLWTGKWRILSGCSELFSGAVVSFDGAPYLEEWQENRYYRQKPEV